MPKTNADQLDSGSGRVLPGVGGFGGAGSRHDGRVVDWVDKTNHMKNLGLTRMQRKSLTEGTECFIYNVSPLFAWTRKYKGFGDFVFPKKTDQKARWSAPTCVPAAFPNSYDRGDRRRVPYIEDGIEIAESLVGCSKDYPTALKHITNDLTNFGVVITYGVKMEDLPEEDQEQLYVQAKTAHDTRCQEMVNKGDQLYEINPQMICETHRAAAAYLDSEGLLVGGERRWVTRKVVKAKDPMKECAFCGHENKVKASKCANCKEVIDHKLYAEQKKAIKEASAEKEVPAETAGE
jgi:hypothetical protein